MKPTSRLKPPEPLTQALQKALDRWDLSSKLHSYQLFEDWPRMVGKAIAAKARPTHYQGECLVVEVDHPAWMQELSLLKQQLLKKISREYPKIKVREIRLVLKS